jgi:excinuclease ABC subunit C
MGSSVRPSKMNKGKIDFNRQIGLYPERSTKTEYARTIRHIKLFFQGKKKQIVSELNKQMLAYAKREEFEKAHQLKKRIFALQHIQDVALIKDEVRTYRDNRNVRIEAYDVAHLQGSDMVGVMTVVENGERHPSAYRKFIIKGFDSSNDPGALKEILTRRFMHTEWNIPDIIVVDGSTAQVNVAHHVLKKHGLVVPVVAIVKDETHKPKDIIGAKKLIDEYKDLFLLANSEAHRFAVTFHRKRRSKRIKL